MFTAVACFRPVLPHWGLIGLASLFPLLGRNWAARLEKRPETTRRFLFASACASLGLLSLAIAEYRYGWLQRGADGRWGLVDTSTDPTLDLYGWDQVADRIDQLGLIDDPRTFVFAPLLVSKRPALLTRSTKSAPSSATTPPIRVGSPSGASLKTGSAATESWS